MAYRVGEQLGNYRLERLLGRGGFAEVYLGKHIHIHRQAAIKVLHTRLAEDAIANFRQEAQIIAELRHPHIVTIFDFDLQENIPFLVMDYYPQGSLRQRHPRGTRLALDVVVDYVEQLAEALDYAHEKRIIHRDVKPENMLIGAQEEIILADFGIAAIAHSTTSMSKQIFAGTPYYMAPEQIRSYGRPASDQYALATVVYEWLAGSPPFQGTVLEIYAKQVLAEPQPLRERVPDLAPEVEQVVLTALRKDPQQRFVSVTAFATAFAAAACAEQESQGRSSIRQEVASTQLVQEHVTGGQSGPQGNFGTPAPAQATPPEVANVIPPLLQKPRSGKGRSPAVVALIMLFLLSGGGAFLGGVRWEYIQLAGRANVSPLVTISHTQIAATASAGALATGTAALIQAHPYPSYLPGKGHLLWYDSMASSANWETGENKDNTGACELTGGIYHTTRTAPGFRWCVGGYALGQLRDFAFEIRLAIVKGDCGGIEFRENDQTYEAYMFVICQGGQEDLYKYLPAHNILQYLAGSASNSAVHSGLNQDNVLDVVAQGSLLTLFINQHQVGQVWDGSNQQGYLGTAAVEQHASTDVTFHDVTLWTF